MKKNTKKWWQKILATIDPADKRLEAQQAAEWCDEQEMLVTQHIADLDAEIQALDDSDHPGTKPGADDTIRSYRRMSIFLLVVDAWLQFVLITPAFQLSLWIGVLAGAATAAGLAVFTFLGLWVVTPRARPSAGITLGEWAAGATGAVGIPAGIVALTVRWITGDQVLAMENLVVYSTWVSAELLPFCGGAIHYAAFQLSTPKRKREARRRTERDLAGVREFRQRLARFVTVVVMAAIVLLMPAMATASTIKQPTGMVQVSATASRSAGVMEVVPAKATHAARGLPSSMISVLEATCVVLVDQSRSGEPKARGETIENLKGPGLWHLVQTLGCERLVFAGFTDRGPFMRRREMRVPAVPSELDCDNLEVPARTGKAAFTEQLPAFRQGHVDHARTQCMNRLAGQQEEVRGFVLASGLVLEELAMVTEVTNTDIWGAVGAALVHRPTWIIVVTDGIHEAVTPVPSLPAGTGLLAVVYPAKPESGGEAATLAAVEGWKDELALDIMFYTEVMEAAAWLALTRERGAGGR